VSSVASRYDAYSRSYDALYRGEQEEKLRAALGAGWKPGGRLVDLGCGTALLTNRLARSCDLAVGLDISVGMLRQAKRRKRVELVLADAAFPPFRPRAFDSCSCFTSFHDFRRKAQAIRGIVRIVREGGSNLFSLLSRGGASHDEAIVAGDPRLEAARVSRVGNDLLVIMTRPEAIHGVEPFRNQQL
jgi:ubiquinone/menaquinone biosynthesis C-methylase UbiE